MAERLKCETVEVERDESVRAASRYTSPTCRGEQPDGRDLEMAVILL
jgi:hypothetical protein